MKHARFFLLSFVLVLVGGLFERVHAGWQYYGGTYYSGATKYGSCYYQGYYYQSGYWVWYDPPINITVYNNPPAVLTTVQYQPAVQASYQTSTTQAVQTVDQRVTSISTASGVSTSTAGTAVAAAPASSACHAKIAELQAQLTQQQEAFAQFTLDMKLLRAKSAEEENAILRQELLRRTGKLASQAKYEPEQIQPPKEAAQPANDQQRISNAAGLLVDHCADCHHASEASKRKRDDGSTGFVLFDQGEKKDGKWVGVRLLNVSDSKLDDLVDAIQTTKAGAMPPLTKRDKYPPLSKAEVEEVKWLVGKMKAAKKAAPKEAAPAPKEQAEPPGEAKKP